MTQQTPQSLPVRLSAVALALAGLTAGIALWHALEQTPGQQGLGLGSGAVLIYASARGGAALYAQPASSFV